MLNIEILSPAGNTESLYAALNSGADAVYLGVKKFSARNNAENFDYYQLEEVIRLCHISGVKVYLTLNTLIFDEEINSVREIVDYAKSVKVDAFIIQDLAVLSIIKAQAPHISVHASTQMSINSAAGVKALEKLGFSRVVLARELSVNEIKNITKDCNIETEIFIHGALCVSISGQCYMSAMLGGRSGNRGNCAQPCRLEFGTNCNSNALSLKDLSLIECLSAVCETGVTSVKIEGRMKRPEYVALVTNACYKIKNGLELTASEISDIKSVFSRSGFTKGYFDDNYSDMIGIRTKNDVTAADTVRCLYNKPLKRRKLDIDIIVQSNQEIDCTVKTSEIKAIMKFPPAKPAASKPITENQISAQLRKLGGTIFEAGTVNCKIDDGLYLSLSELNGIRRTIIEKITEKILESI